MSTSSAKRKKVLITGAAGNIGGKLARSLKDRYDLVLLDRSPNENPNIAWADLVHYDHAWVEHFEDVSTVLHLAANPHTEASWQDLIPDNIMSLLNVCIACIERRVDRLIFASSCHTMCGYKGKEIGKISADMTPAPFCNYGISKLIGERMIKPYTEAYPLSAICLRIGWVPRGEIDFTTIDDPWLRNLWLSKRDLVQVFKSAIEAKAVNFEVVYAMSANEGMNWDLTSAKTILGYQPLDGRQGKA